MQQPAGLTAASIEARRRGIRVAARLAIAGIAVGAVAAATASASAAGSNDTTTIDRVTDLVNVRAQSGGCGCAPCWGPPAPPAMPSTSPVEPISSEVADA